MAIDRKIRLVAKSKPTVEGAGVHLKRAFGFGEVKSFDPFLLLDDFRSDNPEQYIKGFPWHPHRGIETITYVLHGKVEHEDSLGNKGVIESGDVQWMTAGSGIIHQEMPKVEKNGLLWGFQLWANLPSAYKMMAPRYQEITSDQIPEITLDNGTVIHVICGQVNGKAGPVQDIVTEPQYLDITVPAETETVLPIASGLTALAYVIAGQGYFCREKKPFSYEVRNTGYDATRQNPLIGNENLILFDAGDRIYIATASESVRFLLMTGKPIGEPVAWYGPIVMNTQQELEIAFNEYRDGTFLKHHER